VASAVTLSITFSLTDPFTSATELCPLSLFNDVLCVHAAS
jgi:hypothetical protein